MIKLAAPTTIDDEIRTPIEGPIIVTDEEAERLGSHGLVLGEPEELPADLEALYVDEGEIELPAPAARRRRRP